MTTTTSMCGLGADEKSTSRVLKPPGGGSSDIFGTSASNPTPPRKQHRTDSDIFGVQENKQTPSTCGIPGAEEHKIYGKGRNQSRYNPITGEPYEDDGSPSPADIVVAKPRTAASPAVGASAGTPQEGQGDANLQAAPGKAQPEVHTSSRVLNPPGGHTHKLW